MSDESTRNLKVGDPVRLKDSDQRLRGDVWQLRTGRYVIVRWEDRARTTHSESAIELDVRHSETADGKESEKN